MLVEFSAEKKARFVALSLTNGFLNTRNSYLKLRNPPKKCAWHKNKQTAEPWSMHLLTCARIPCFQRCRAVRALRKPKAYPRQQYCLFQTSIKCDRGPQWSCVNEWRCRGLLPQVSAATAEPGARSCLWCWKTTSAHRRAHKQTEPLDSGRRDPSRGASTFTFLPGAWNEHTRRVLQRSERKGAHFLKHQVWWSGC